MSYVDKSNDNSREIIAENIEQVAERTRQAIESYHRLKGRRLMLLQMYNRLQPDVRSDPEQRVILHISVEQNNTPRPTGVGDVSYVTSSPFLNGDQDGLPVMAVCDAILPVLEREIERIDEEIQLYGRTWSDVITVMNGGDLG